MFQLQCIVHDATIHLLQFVLFFNSESIVTLGNLLFHYYMPLGRHVPVATSDLVEILCCLWYKYL